MIPIRAFPQIWVCNFPREHPSSQQHSVDGVAMYYGVHSGITIRPNTGTGRETLVIFFFVFIIQKVYKHTRAWPHTEAFVPYVVQFATATLSPRCTASPPPSCLTAPHFAAFLFQQAGRFFPRSTVQQPLHGGTLAVLWFSASQAASHIIII